jgi:hypothetical protein
MFQVKFLIVSLLAFGLKESDSQVLGINDTATFTVSL